MNRPAPGSPASASNIEQARGVYRRLLGYARPFVGMYLLGVLGMLLYAGTDLLTITFTKSYLTSALALEQQALIQMRSGAPDAARDILRQLAADVTVPEGVRNRANGLLAKLGG